METLAASNVPRVKMWLLALFVLVQFGWCWPRALAAAPNPLVQQITSYAITSANDRPERDPKDWRLLGSNDGGSTWTLLDERKGEVFSNRLQRRLFSIKSPAAFNTYRLQIDSVNLPPLADSVQLAELEFLTPKAQHDGMGEPLDQHVRAAGENQPSESAVYAFDHRTETKWLDFASKNPTTRASWIEAQYAAAAPEITNVSLLILERAGETRQSRPIRLNANIAGIDTTGNLVELLDGSGAVEIPLTEGAAKFKVGQSVLLTGRSSWVEVKQADGKARSEATILDPRLTLLGDDLPPPQKPQDYTAIAARAATDAKIVVQYALTSANDRPGRDPKAWRLLASNDNGLTWVMLDQRTEEVFPLRLQRRLFSITNITPYNIYRLQIDSISGRFTENAVQLAEFELISPPEEDQRIARFSEPFVSAEGENPPREGVAAAFDGRAETKWLDFAFENRGTSWLQVQYRSIPTQATSIAQLKELAHQPVQRTLQVHIEGILANFDARRQELYFLDRTGGIYIPANSAVGTCRPGQEVLLEGQSASAEQEGTPQTRHAGVIVRRPRITVLQKPAPEPERLRPGQPLEHGSVCRLAEVVGTLRFVSQNAAAAVLELSEANERIKVFCCCTNAEQFRRYLNLRLRARGVCEGILNEQSTLIAGRLWVPDSESISLAEPTDNEWNAFPLTAIARLHPALGPYSNVIRVRGTATGNAPGEELILTEDFRTLYVQSRVQQKIPSGSQVEALGFLSWRDQVPVLLQASFRSVAATNADAQAGSILLTQVEQILRLSPNAQELNYDARIRGVVTSPSGYVNDETGGIYVERLKEMGGRSGDLVEVFGHAGSGQAFGLKSYSPVILADGLRVLGRGRWPEPKTFSWNYLMTGRPDGQWIEVTGIGRAANTNVLTLSVEGGQLQASVVGAKPEEMKHWIDAGLKIRGIYRTSFNPNGQFQGFSLDVPDVDCVQVDNAPPADPFSVPSQKIGTLMTYDPLEKLAHRRKIVGVVSHAEAKFFFVQDSSGGLQVKPITLANVHPGDTVEVVGFPKGGGFAPTLVEALVRQTGTDRLPTLARIDLDGLFQGEHEGSLVSIQATMLGQKVIGSTAILELQDQQKTFSARLPAAELGGADCPPGSRVELHGVYKADRNLDEHGIPRVSAFDFFLNKSRDVVVLARPSWWTVKHTAWVLGILGTVLLAGTGWLLTLKHEVDRQTAFARERMLAESALQKLMVSLVETLPQSILRKDLAGRFTFVNGFFCRAIGRSKEEILGKTDFDLFPAELATKFRLDDERVIASGTSFETEEENRTANGEKVYVQVIKTPLYDAEQKAIGIQIVFWDVTARKQAEHALRAQEERTRSIIDQAFDAIVTTDSDAKIIGWNRQAEATFGWSATQAMGRKLTETVVPPRNRQQREADFDRFRQTGEWRLQNQLFETTGVHQDGHEIPIEVSITPIWVGNTCIFNAFLRDISERKKAEAELAYERDLLRTLMDNSPAVIYFKDLQSRFVRFSNSLASVFHFADAQSLRGKTDFDVFTEEHARPAFEDEQQIIRTGKPVLGKVEKETHADGRVTWAMTSKLPWRDENGNIIGTFGISENITSIKEAEAKFEALHRQLVDASRQAGMAEVATSVLHNVGNVLNSINVASTVIEEHVRKSRASDLNRLVKLLGDHTADLATFLSADPRGRKVPEFLAQLAQHLAAEQSLVISELASLRKNIGHIKDIVAMQQSYAKVSGVVENIEVTELVEDTLRMNAEGLARHDVRVIREFSPLPSIITDKHKVLQILINLVRNAKYACVESGRSDKQVTVRINNGEDRIKISVIDNGVGIRPENLTRIFNHGFTTRKEGHGFGLHSGALAAQELGGTLAAQSEGPGKGAAFTLELPKKPPPGTIS